jgi:hypothetical protein
MWVVDLTLAMMPRRVFKKYLRQDKICQRSYPHVGGYAARASQKPFIAELYMNDASNGVRLITGKGFSKLRARSYLLPSSPLLERTVPT